ncbi:MAG: InlB B-repeat-containing protein [Nocardioides sp.]
MDIRGIRHARRWARHVIVALAGAVLVAPPLVLAPATAAQPAPNGPLDPLLGFLAPVEPVVSGAGSVTSTVSGLACSNPTGASDVTCSGAGGLSLLELAGLPSVVLTAVPAEGWELVGWTGCSSTSGADCVLDSSLPGAVISPVATFEPTDPLPDPCGSVPLPTCDTTPPVTSITQKPTVVTGNRTKEKAASFGFKAFEPDENGTATATETENATFECQLVGPGQTSGFTACTTPKVYQNLVDGQYTFSVRALDDAATPNTDETPETFTWTVDTTAPQTSITSGPSTWVLAGRATFGLSSTEPGSTFRCTLDDSGRICGSSGGTVSFAPGTHTFAAFARDAVGNDDVTAATRTFTMPLNNKDLNHSRGWKKGKGSGHFLSTYSSTTKKGAALSTSSSAIKQVALVVTKGKGYGVVKVYLGTKLLKKVSLSAKRTRKAKLVKIASFPAVTSGKVKVVVASKNKKVVIEGLGIASR